MSDWTQITADFRQKYEGTYIRASLQEDAPYEVFFVRKIVPGTPPQLLLENEKWGEIQLNYDTELDISFDFPEVGYFLSEGKHASLFTKMFIRQWKRGICAGTAQVFHPYSSFLLMDKNKINEETVTAAFEPRQLCSFEQASFLLTKREALSVPLSPSFALGLHTSEKPSLLLLWFLSMPIGEYDPEKNTIYLPHAPQMEQEIKDFLNQVGEHCAIIC